MKIYNFTKNTSLDDVIDYFNLPKDKTAKYVEVNNYSLYSDNIININFEPFATFKNDYFVFKIDNNYSTGYSFFYKGRNNNLYINNEWVYIDKIYNDIYKIFFNNNKIHNYYGEPAMINYKYGNLFPSKLYYVINGKYHNISGPAVREFTNSKWNNSFFINGSKISLDVFCKISENKWKQYDKSKYC
jgi:hypothetical protein